MYIANTPHFVGLSFVCLLAAGCAVGGPDTTEGGIGTTTQAASLEWKDNGTSLSATLNAAAGVCDNGQIRFNVDGQVTSTASASQVELVAYVGGAEFSSTVVIESGQFQKSGKVKTAPFAKTILLPDGGHAAMLCLAQHGSEGRSSKMACTQAFDYVADCPLPKPVAPILPAVDNLPPEILASRTPEPNASGWNNTDVVVAFACTDNVAVSFCSAPVLVSAEGAGQSVTGRAVDSRGLEATATVSEISIDRTNPVVTDTVDRPANEHGWYADDVIVSFSCSDSLSGVGEVSDPVVLTEEGEGLAASGFCLDRAGNIATASRTDVSIDRTDPTAEILGGRTYFVDESVNVSCTFADALSGVDQRQCDAVSGEAYTFALGEHPVRATVTDLAGNFASADAAFTIDVDAQSLCNLLDRLVTKSGVAHALCVKVQGAEVDLARGQTQAAMGKLGAYQNQLQAQAGKAVPREFFEVLSRLGAALATR